VQSAITSGNVRRGYLKGLGEARGCSSPATPQHLSPPVVEPGMPPPVPPGSGHRPRFPIN
jgi:hypothetical protein